MSRERLEAGSPEELVDAVVAGDPSEVIVAIDSAVTLPKGVDGEQPDTDIFVSLASVLVTKGVRAFETAHPQVVRRVFDMHRALSTGDVEVLQP